jgi:hypothetical protein
MFECSVNLWEIEGFFVKVWGLWVGCIEVREFFLKKYGLQFFQIFTSSCVKIHRRWRFRVNYYKV